MPGTTLGTIPLRVFEGNKGVLYDTAGLHLHHRLNNMLPPDDLRALHPKRRLKPYVASVDAEEMDDAGAPARRYKWGALVRPQRAEETDARGAAAAAPRRGRSPIRSDRR